LLSLKIDLKIQNEEYLYSLNRDLGVLLRRFRFSQKVI
jgi:hypothetical protein